MTDNLAAKSVLPCAAAETVIVVYGQQLGRKLTACTDKYCPLDDPQAAAEAAAHIVPMMAPEIETERRPQNVRPSSGGKERTNKPPQPQLAASPSQPCVSPDAYAKPNRGRASDPDSRFERLTQNSPRLCLCHEEA